jgi:hypothetical protein
VRSASPPQLADAAIDPVAENGTAANPPTTCSDAVAATANQRAKSIWNYLPGVFASSITKRVDRYSARQFGPFARDIELAGISQPI